MKRIKNFSIICVLAILLIAGYLVYRSHFTQPTMSDFVTHLHGSGLSVVESQSDPSVENAVKPLGQALDAYDATHKSTPRPEVGHYDIGGIKNVSIYKYASPEDALWGYQYFMNLEQRLDADAQSHGFARIDITEYLRAGKYFVIAIPYFSIGGENGRIDTASLHAVALPQNDLDRLRTAAAGWKD